MKILVVFLLKIAKRYDILFIIDPHDLSEAPFDKVVDAINDDIGFVSSLVATHITCHSLRFICFLSSITLTLFDYSRGMKLDHGKHCNCLTVITRCVYKTL